MVQCPWCQTGSTSREFGKVSSGPLASLANTPDRHPSMKHNTSAWHTKSRHEVLAYNSWSTQKDETQRASPC